MASTFTDLGLELMATGENAGTWGTKTNANLSLIEQLTGGVLSLAVAGSGTTALTIQDGALTGTAQQRIIELTGALTGSRVLTFPLLTETFYIIKNGTTNAQTLQLKAASGSGATVTFAADNKGYKLIYLDGVATNTGVFEMPFGVGDVTLTGTQTLTNKTLTSPTIGTKIADTNGNELLLLTATGSAVNEFTLANASTGNGPTLSATGETNVGININPKGTGVLKSGSGAVKIAGLETMWIPASAMYASTTNGADPEQIETTANSAPDMKVFDFDASTKQHTQFSVAFPKSWNEGTITYQCFWTPSTTNTGNCLFRLSAVSVADGATIDVTFGTEVEITDAGVGTVEDQQVSAVSGAVTVKSAAVDTQTYFKFAREAGAGGDTFTGEARVLGIKLFFTTDAANDA